jgi:hypothetical protein
VKRVWVIDKQWTYAPDTNRQCRWTGQYVQCGEPAVAFLPRGETKVRFYYCADHLYGRRIHNGQVEVSVLRETLQLGMTSASSGMGTSEVSHSEKGGE